MNIVLVGYGSVGRSFISLLKEKEKFLINKGIDIKLIAVFNSSGGLFDEEGIDLDYLASLDDLRTNPNFCENLDYEEIVTDFKIDYAIITTPTNFLTGEPGLSYIRSGIKNNVNIITADKGPIVLNYKELKKFSKKNGVYLGIGCTTGGALPTAVMGEFGISGSEVLEIEGILNGTTNFILDSMYYEDISFYDALEKAKRLNICETDPSNDLSGYDSAIKLIIIANIVFEDNFDLENVKILGINKDDENYIRTMKEKNKKIKIMSKLTNIDGKIELSVFPEELGAEDMFYNIKGKNKGILFKTDVLGDIFLSGGESGTKAAAASLLRDILNHHNN